MKLWLDLETFSEADLKEVGTYRYADEARVLLFAYAIDEAPPTVWDCGAEAMPDELQYALQCADEIWAQNAQFDKAVLNAQGHAIGVPPLALPRWRCSMAMALSHALPASLAALCTVLKVPDDMSKLAEGTKLVQLFTRPQPANRKVRLATRDTHPGEWERFKAYAAHDIIAMRECVRRMPTWNWDDSAVAEWHCDQRINERGFHVDRELTRAGARAALVEKERIGVRFRQLTQGVVERPSQREQFKAFIQGRFGVTLENTTRDTFEQMMKSGAATGELKELMQLSIASNKTSTAKYAALDPAVQGDDRFRGGLQFAGAGRTRRWAGRLFQPQNLPSRGLPDAEEVELYIEHLKAGSHDLFFDNLMLFGAAALRGIVVAPPGKKLLVADLANIEGRMLSWVAGENWKLDAFRAYDAGTGPDLYNVTASSILGGDPWKVSKKDRNVFGKVPDLACFTGDTQVLTDRGLVAIMEVLPTDKVWDGVEWVDHQGVLEKDARRVVNVDGIAVTPDHLVNTKGTWKRAEELVLCASTLSLALATGLESFKSLASTEALAAEYGECKHAVLAEPKPTFLKPTCEQGKRQGVTDALSQKRVTHESTTGGTKPFAPMKNTVGGYSTGSPLVSTDAVTQTIKRTTTTEGAEYEFSNLGLKTEGFFSPISSTSHPGTNPNWSLTESTSISGMNPATCGSLRAVKTLQTSGQSEPWKPESESLKPVYDLLNAGPRNRFLIKSSSGWLLVHNCGYMGGVAGFQTFAHAYGVRLADYWDTIQRQIAPGLVAKAKENLESWGRDSQDRLEISDLEWIASETCKLAWRARHPATVRFWYDLQDAAKKAISDWGSIQTAGRYIKVRCVTHAGLKWMVVRLPSGRYLTYFDPRLVDNSITYMGESAEEGKTTRQWVRVYTHGGKMTGNCLTAETRVFTSAGLKAITQVRSGDLVWDGASWVATDGVLAQGRKAVGSWLGLGITRDHLIYDGASWMPVERVSASFATRALIWASRSAPVLATLSTPSTPWRDEGRSEPVFDLLNCGPHNRFTVLTDSGPVVVHNCCQTLARDILMPALQEAETRGYLPVLSVHDEAITEAPDTDEFSAQGLIEILSQNPKWADGLPLAAAGFEARRYKKD